MTSIDSQARRRLLQLALASATSLGLGSRAWSQPRFDSNPFALGVASGSPTQDSVVLWTRLVANGGFGSRLGSAAIAVVWEVANDENFSRIVRAGQVQALAELGHSVHVEVSGLEADHWFFYRFMVGDALSQVGRTRTLPAADAAVSRLRLAYASCQRWEHGYFSAYRHMRNENLDAVVFLGDYIYEYPGSTGQVREGLGSWAVSLDDYRQRYALYKGDEDLQAMHAACPWLVTWDDHEVQNDYAGLRAGSGGPAVADFAARRAAAYQAYYEHMPLPASVLTEGLGGMMNPRSGAEMRIYRRLDFGRLASIYLLDGRQYRDPQACTAEGSTGSRSLDPASCPQWRDPARSMLGPRQERWLEREFARAGEAWNVVGQQTLFGRLDRQIGPGEILWSDGWDGYGAARTRLTDSLARNRVANPVILGGDVHQNWVGHVKSDYLDPASPTVGVEFCGTSISSRGPQNPLVAERLAENPHFVFADGERKGYGVADFTPQRLEVSLRVVDDVTRKDTAVATLARFSVAAGKSAVERE